MISTKNIPPHERLIFALDVPDYDRAKELVEELGDAVHFYKVGLELFMAGDYYAFVDWLTARGKKVFADLKFFDVPKTVESAVRQLSDKGVAFATVHGNQAIMEAAAAAKGDTMKILGVTVLTSLDRGDLDDLGFAVDVEDLVWSRAKRVLETGCDGVISSGMEAPAIREKLGQKILVVTPGIRPVDNNDDQKRTVNVTQAFENGADYIVVGRPIRDHHGFNTPREAAQSIQETIEKIF